MDLINEYWLKEAQNMAKLGVFVYDLRTNTWISSEILDEIFGIDSSYVKDFEGWLKLFHQSERTDMVSCFHEVIRTRGEMNKEYRIVNQIDGSEIWVKGKVKVYSDEQGIPKKLIGILQDISELKRSEKRYENLYADFQRKQSFFKSLINFIPDLFFYKDINGTYLGCNKAFEVFSGMEEKELIGNNDFHIFDEEMAETFIRKDLEVIKKGENSRNEEWVKYPDGKLMLLDTLKTPYYDSEGNILGIIGISRDITERNKKEELQKSIDEERRRLNELKEYDRLKTEFFSNISHELRTPVNVIFSALQLLELKLKSCSCENASTNVHKYTKMMKQNCYRLLRLINNLIDITKIDNDYFYINEINYDIISLVENITLSVAEYIEDKGLSLIFDTEIEEKIISCDPEKIERIILNLLSNAIKFTPHGGNIYINIEDKGEKICIRVKDTGRGIPIEKMNFIFERFIQVDKTFTRDHEGSGIGLSLVKALVELHDGSVKVVSELEKGSEFIVELPVKTLEGDDFRKHPQYNEDSKFYVNKLDIEFSDIYFSVDNL